MSRTDSMALDSAAARAPSQDATSCGNTHASVFAPTAPACPPREGRPVMGGRRCW